jgi:N-acetylglutamate synthase-like GNAT family acetyltransferase
MANLVVRQATGTQDIATVRKLMRAYGEHLAAHPAGAANICIQGYEQELERLPEGYLALLLMMVDGEPAGCVALREMKQDKHVCEMKRLWVDPRFRGLGVGRRLVEEAISRAEQMGFEAIYLDTVPAAMPEANRLYTAMGFIPVERYNDSLIVDVAFFRKRLGQPKN